jgi:hypothetical protein
MGQSVRLSVTPLLQHKQNYMSKGNKGSQPERELEAEAKRALRISGYIQRDLKQHLHRDSYITALNQCLEKRCAIYVLCATSDEAPMVHV